MISSEGFYIALAWLRAGITERREFAPLQADLAALDDMHRQGYDAFMQTFREWTPARLDAYAVPKEGGGSREVFYIPVFDRVATLALLTTDYDQLEPSLRPMQTSVDMSHPLPQDPMADTTWFVRHRDEYMAFRNRTLGLQAEGHEMVFTDVARFSSSIQLRSLCETLKGLGMHTNRANQLFAVLDQWQVQDGVRGVPQGYVMTDLLMKACMHPVDRIMGGLSQITYYRYNDDIRLAARDARMLQRGFDALDGVLEQRGLTLNAAKTSWHATGGQDGKAKDSLRIEDYLQPCWDGVRLTDADFRDSPTDIAAFKPYDALPPALLRSVYKTHVAPRADGSIKALPSTVFHFTLRRMAKGGVADFLPHVADLCRNHVDRMPQVLDCIAMVSKQGHDVTRAVHAMRGLLFDPAGVYGPFDHSRYVFMRFLGDMAANPVCAAMIADMDGKQPDTPFMRRAIADVQRLRA